MFLTPSTPDPRMKPSPITIHNPYAMAPATSTPSSLLERVKAPESDVHDQRTDLKATDRKFEKMRDEYPTEFATLWTAIEEINSRLDIFEKRVEKEEAEKDGFDMVEREENDSQDMAVSGKGKGKRKCWCG